MTVVFIWCRRRRAADGAKFGIHCSRGRGPGAYLSICIYIYIYVCVCMYAYILYTYIYISARRRRAADGAKFGIYYLRGRRPGADLFI